MKRIGNLWDKIVSKENIKLAYAKAKRHKAWQRKVIAIEKQKDKLLNDLQESLVNGTYHTAKYRIKTIYEPKKREIYILPFYPDRIVHHAIMNVLEPIWDSYLINDTYACRKGKGQHKGSTRCMEFVRKNKFCLKCDISKFYPSIPHAELKILIRRKIKCKKTLVLLDEIIDSVDTPTNVPIGNYLSQWFGNLYMHPLDNFIKQDNHIKCYIRYCDDFLLFSNNKDELKLMAKKIEDFVVNNLKLKLSKCNLLPTSQGIDFLGYRHFPQGYILIRKTTVRRMRRNLKKLDYAIDTNKISKLRAASKIGSIYGWLKWANTYNLQKSLKLNDFKERIDKLQNA